MAMERTTFEKDCRTDPWPIVKAVSLDIEDQTAIHRDSEREAGGTPILARMTRQRRADVTISTVKRDYKHTNVSHFHHV